MVRHSVDSAVTRLIDNGVRNAPSRPSSLISPSPNDTYNEGVDIPADPWGQIPSDPWGSPLPGATTATTTTTTTTTTATATTATTATVSTGAARAPIAEKAGLGKRLSSFFGGGRRTEAEKFEDERRKRQEEEEKKAQKVRKSQVGGRGWQVG